MGIVAWFVAVMVVAQRAGGLDNSLARAPPLGWMSWGYYGCGVHCDIHPDKCLNEELIMSVADKMSDEGYAEAGYEFVVVDDCWAELSRGANGSLIADRRRFPRGIKFLADYVHGRGLKFGLYGSVGDVTCMRYPGSRRHLRRDAATFAAWGVDYVKLDGCFVEEDHLNTVYTEFGKYLNETGRPMVFSCSWPYYVEFIHHHMPDYNKVAQTCNLWRNYHDMALNWRSVRDIVRHYEREHVRMASYSGPGRWNDPDMIAVGTGVLTPGQSRVQLAVWAMLSAPLLLSCDLGGVSAWERALLLNPYLLAIDQDALGLQAVPYKPGEPQVTLWIKKQMPMKADTFHSYSLAFVNLEVGEGTVRVTPRQYGLHNPDGYTVMNIFAGVLVRNLTLDEALPVTVPGEDVILYTLFPL